MMTAVDCCEILQIIILDKIDLYVLLGVYFVKLTQVFAIPL